MTFSKIRTNTVGKIRTENSTLELTYLLKYDFESTFSEVVVLNEDNMINP